MRKLFIALLYATLGLAPCYAQQGVSSQRFVAAVAGNPINLVNTSIAYHKLTWSVSGTASACTVALDTSTNGTIWSAGGAITGQTCTSNGSSSTVNVSANYVRMNMTALTITGGSSVTVTWDGYTSNPASGGTVTNIATSAPLSGGPITSTGTLSCPTCATGPGSSTSGDGAKFSGTGGLTLADSGIVNPSASGSAIYAEQVCATTLSLGISAISSASKTVLTATCNGLASTDQIITTFAADPTSTTGYIPSASGMLTIVTFPTSNTINVDVVNNTANSITPGAAITLNLIGLHHGT